MQLHACVGMYVCMPENHRICYIMAAYVSAGIGAATDSRQLLDSRMHVVYVCVLYCIVLYCIVLYLYMYIARLAVHTNQKRFQCERPREKRAVLRERKEALGSLINKVDRVEGRSWFQSDGPMIAKARV